MIEIFNDHPDTRGQDLRYVVFYTKAVEDQEASELQGVPVFRNVPFIRIRSRDDPFSDTHEQVEEWHRLTWPRQWALYERAETVAADGVPIEMFPILRPAQVAGLKHHGITTIERLAAVPDDQLPKLDPTAAALRDRARQYLQPDSKTVAELRAKVRDQAKTIGQLKAQLEAALHAATEARAKAA